jgi:hypothetical protein
MNGHTNDSRFRRLGPIDIDERYKVTEDEDGSVTIYDDQRADDAWITSDFAVTVSVDQ